MHLKIYALQYISTRSGFYFIFYFWFTHVSNSFILAVVMYHFNTVELRQRAPRKVFNMHLISYREQK